MSALADFVGRLALSLRARSVLYSGCFAADIAPPEGARACVACQDPAELARCLESARAEAAQAPPSRLPWPGGEFDLVVSRGLAGGGAAEALRVSRAYVASFEGDGARQWAPRIWGGLDARAVSDVRVHPDIDPSEPRFVLVRKNRRP